MRRLHVVFETNLRLHFFMANRATFLLLLFVFISGCSSVPILTTTTSELAVGRIRIDSTSNRQDGSAEMISRCSGFLLTAVQVRGFLEHAARFMEEVPDKYYKVLPCSSTGTVVINKQKYAWVIRAGGIGEFTASGDHFFMVCGKNCCDKVQGIC